MTDRGHRDRLTGQTNKPGAPTLYRLEITMSDIRRMLDEHVPYVAPSTESGHILVNADDFRQLWELAHEAVHPSDPDDDNTSIERGYDEDNLRMTALHLAAQQSMGQIQAAHGLEVRPDTVGLAESFLHFLKGKGSL